MAYLKRWKANLPAKRRITLGKFRHLDGMRKPFAESRVCKDHRKEEEKILNWLAGRWEGKDNGSGGANVYCTLSDSGVRRRTSLSILAEEWRRDQEDFTTEADMVYRIVGNKELEDRLRFNQPERPKKRFGCFASLVFERFVSGGRTVDPRKFVPEELKGREDLGKFYVGLSVADRMRRGGVLDFLAKF